MNTSLNSALTAEQLYATLTIANGKNIEINGTTYTCIDSVSNSTNGYQVCRSDLLIRQIKKAGRTSILLNCCINHTL